MAETIRTVRYGKISNVYFGLCGYGDLWLGLHVVLSSDMPGSAWNVENSIGFPDFNRSEHTDSCDWTEALRLEWCVNTARTISNILNEAKVSSVDQLKGVPVRAIFDGNMLKQWEILREVR